MYSEAYFEGLEEVLGAEGMGIATTMFGIAVVVYILIFIAAILNYVFSSLALYTVGKRRGLRLYGLGWVPVAQHWLLGSIADQYDREAKGRDMKHRRFLLIGSIVICVVAVLSAIIMVVGSVILLSAEMMGAAEPTSGMAALIISVILMLLIYIFLLVWMVFYFIALFKYFKSCSPRNAVWMLVLSIVIGGLFTTISMFCVRKKDGGFEALQQEEPAEEALEEPAEMPALNEPEEE